MGKLAQVGLMQSLAAEGAAWNIRVNAVAPVAATRMLRRQVEPGTFRPEHVAPGVAFLASAQCEQSGIILQMGDRHFSTARYARGQEITLAPDALTPEAIADRWQALLTPPA
jgi:NAD(P)-dependent dehydrogenase (short-subunit alcohol dehydrogenase family)